MSESGPAIIGAICIPLSFVVASLARRFALRRQLLDRPNERSAHARPTPRLGGLGIMVAFLAAAAAYVGWTGRVGHLVPLSATATIALVGLMDDVRGTSARLRLGVQIVAAAMVVTTRGAGLPASLGVFGDLPFVVAAPLSVLFIVWLTNLFNFMDGIDGLAGGQAVIGAIAVALAAASVGAADTMWLALFLAAGALGFLLLNFPPASIFMGDVGSTAIGFFFGCVPFLPERRPVPVDVVTLAIALFVLDATTTLLRRLAAGERLAQAHRGHWYQRPLALGIPHRTITLAAYAAMVVVAGGAVVYAGGSGAARILAGAVPLTIFIAIAGGVRTLERSGTARGTAASSRLEP